MTSSEKLELEHLGAIKPLLDGRATKDLRRATIQERLDGSRAFELQLPGVDFCWFCEP